MIELSCRVRIKDRSGNIVGYRLVDNHGLEKIIGANKLKALIRNKQVVIDNLLLTKDNRLVMVKNNQDENNESDAFNRLRILSKNTNEYGDLENNKFYICNLNEFRHILYIPKVVSNVYVTDGGDESSYNVINEEIKTLKGRLKVIGGAGLNNYEMMFDGCSSLVNIDLSEFKASKVISTVYMFRNCRSLKSLDLSKIDTSGVTDMTGMFINCNSLQKLNISNLKTHDVTDMMSMFDGCKSLQSIDLSSFDTSEVFNMLGMFTNCLTLKYIDLSTFNTSNVNDMRYMFTGCRSLESVNVSRFNTSKVDHMEYMFEGCESLRSLDLSSFDISNVSSMLRIFNKCRSLEYINTSNWDLSKTDYFESCREFIGCPLHWDYHENKFVK